MAEITRHRLASFCIESQRYVCLTGDIAFIEPECHKAGDTAAIDSAIAALNNAWQEASQQMYAQGQQAGPQPGADAGQGFQGGQQTQSNPNDDVQDADFEEVK